MQRWIWIALLLFVTPASASAQTSNEHRWYGNVFLAPGIATDGDGLGPTLHVGVGFDRFLHRGFGIGGEIGYAGAATAPGFGAALASVNGAYHFKRADKFVPFVTGGYSLLFRSATVNAVNFGGGFNYWFREGLGFRLELRDHVATQDSSAHALGLRIGLTFR
jgi:hypothetical protein